MKDLIVSSLLLILILHFPLFSQTTPRLGKDDVTKVIAAMTIEEKARLVVGMGFRASIPGLTTMSPEDAKVPERVPGAAGRTHAVERLGIPSLTFADGPAGVRIDPKREGDPKTYFATGFPVATAIASSWDTDLAKRLGAAFGREARGYGIDVLLAPGMNIQRNPLGGRNFEYYSEDPLVAGFIAAAFVNGVQSEGVGTSIKHFAANNQEFNRLQSDSIVGERALREIYLKGFEIAVKEGRPWTVMSAYNLVNGTFASQNRELLTGILRDEWGYGGLVMSDWFAGNDPRAQIAAGNDLLMPGTPDQEKAIVNAVRTGQMDEEDLDRSVKRALELILKSLAFKGIPATSKPDLASNARVSLDAATEGMVLLENRNNALPAKKGSKIALYGIRSVETIAGGTGSGDVNKAYVVPVFEGLGDVFEIDGSRVSEYGKYIAEQKAKLPPPLPFFPNAPIPEMPMSVTAVQKDSESADFAVITIGRDSGEIADLKREQEFELSAVENDLLRNVSKAFRGKGKKVVVVLNIGGPVETASWRDQADAILVVWQPGQEAGKAVARVLTGDVNPSGRLAVTFPVSYEDVPSSKSFPGREIPGAKPLINSPLAGKPAEAVYEEGIYVGYRYYSSFGIEPAYPFGYGLSYTSFDYGSFSVKYDRETGITCRVKVTNSGRVSGREVVQVYVGVPVSTAPKRELRGFAKTRLLAPGEADEIVIRVGVERLASFDPERSAWVIPAGNHAVSAGGNSATAAISGNFKIEKEIVVGKTGKLLTPKREIDELRPPDVKR